MWESLASFDRFASRRWETFTTLAIRWAAVVLRRRPPRRPSAGQPGGGLRRVPRRGAVLLAGCVRRRPVLLRDPSDSLLDPHHQVLEVLRVHVEGQVRAVLVQVVDEEEFTFKKQRKSLFINLNLT